MFFVNTKRGEPYVEAGHAYGLDFEHDGRAVAPVDIDGDGDLDLAILSLQGLRLALNQQPARPFVRLRLRAKQGHALGLGAEITLTAGGRTQVAWMHLTEGFHTQIAAEVHFGLGDLGPIESVRVRWPSGRVDTYHGIGAGARYTLAEGGGSARAAIPAWPEQTRPRPARAFDIGLRAAGLDGPGGVIAKEGRPAVVNFWAPSCEACKRELPALGEYAKAAGDAVQVVGVSVETEDLEGAKAFAKKLGLGFDLRLANDDVVAAFFGSSGRIALPATFVFDAQGELQRSFYREIDRAEVAAMVGALASKPALEDFRMLALSHIRKREHRKAGQVLDEARRVLHDSNARARIGTLYLHVGRTAIGRHMLQKATAERPDDVDAWAALGWALRESGDLDAAERAVRHALDRAPKHAHALNHMGRIHEARGNKGAAAEMYRAAVAADPDFVAAKRSLERVSAK